MNVHGLNARALATRVLARVRQTDAYLNAALDTQLAEAPPADPRDTALVTELCYGATRRQLTLDHVVEQFSDRKLDSLEDRVLAALRVGVYQLFFSRVPRRAAVAETVEGLKQLGLSRASGFVNAILRKASALEAIPLPPSGDVVKHLSIRESHPEWLVTRWIRQFGRERAEAMLVADNRPAAVTVRVNRAKLERTALLSLLSEAGVEAQPTALSPVGVVLPSIGKVEDVYGHAEGLWQVQDEAAQLVGVWASLAEGSRVLDACAAPGGKACHLAERCKVVASDVHGHKLRKIDAEAKRLGLSDRLQILAHDATGPYPEGLGEFDAVLVDAPCSGLGTLRRHPELRYRRKEEDLGRLATLQLRLLENCQEKVAAGGILVYAVCTPEPQEGQDLIEMFLRSHPEFTTEPPVLPPEVQVPQWQGHLRTLPGPEGLDGFFTARLRKMY